MKPSFLFFIVFFLTVSTGYGDLDKEPPFVKETFPKHGVTDVDPAVKEISVTFNEPMRDGNFSWCTDDRAKFPVTTGKPYYDKSMKKCILPVKLEPGTTYIIWLNSPKFDNFKDIAGNPAIPFVLVFKTR